MKWTAVVLAMTAWMAAAETAPNPEVLKWQAEAQARERAVQRRIDWQMEKAKRAAEEAKKK